MMLNVYMKYRKDHKITWFDDASKKRKRLQLSQIQHNVKGWQIHNANVLEISSLGFMLRPDNVKYTSQVSFVVTF